MPPAHENPMDVYMMLLKDSRSADDVVKKWSAAVHAERFGVDVTYLDGDSASSRPSHHTNSDTNALASGSDSMWGAGAVRRTYPSSWFRQLQVLTNRNFREVQ